MKRRRLFKFSTGSFVEVFWHEGLKKWGVSHEVPQSTGDWLYFTGFHDTRRKAFKEARAHKIKAVTDKIRGKEVAEFEVESRRRMNLAIEMKRGKGVNLLLNKYGDFL